MNAKFDDERMFFNKWEMYKLFISQEGLLCHIPFTNLLTKQSLTDFIEEGDVFFIKPVNTWSGKQISLVQVKGRMFIWRKQGFPPQFYRDKARMMDSILHEYEDKQTIIQKKAPILDFFRHPFDVRVHLQRDQSREWVYAGDAVRVGGSSSIVSNVFINDGFIAQTEQILMRLFRNPEKVGQIKADLEQVSFQIADQLDKYYPFHDIGADFGIDKEGKLWLIEINTDDLQGRPSYQIFKGLPNKKLYIEMIKREQERNEKWLEEAINEYQNTIEEN